MTPEEMDSIVQDEFHFGEHGHFLNAILEAWMTADPGNKDLMLPLMEKLTKKYEFPSLLVRTAHVERKVAALFEAEKKE